jgi:4-amino-4-deoxy-L-arabinose transferase-like glycosyltransferase
MKSLSPLPQLKTVFGLHDLPEVLADLAPRRQFVFTLAWVALIGFLFFFRLGHRDLYSSHEARAAQNAQRMLDSGDWGLPVLFDGRVDLQKPPGYYWAVAAIGWLNGGRVTEWVVRFPSALAGFVCCLAVFAFLRQEGRRIAAIAAMIVLATANHYVGITRTARIDIPLACAVTVSLLAFYRGCRAAPGRSLAWHLLAAIAAAIALLLKGPVGAALIGPAAFAWLIVERLVAPGSVRPRIPLASWLLIPLVVLALSAPWYVWANGATQGELVRVFFWHHTIDRYTGASPLLASHPWWYYVPRFCTDFLPWTPLLNCLTVWFLRTGRWNGDPIFRFGLISFAVIVGVLSTAHFKRADYLLPAFPFASMAVGAAAESWLASRRLAATARLGQWIFGGLIGVAVVCWLVMMVVVEPAEQTKEEKRAFAAMIRSAAPAPTMILQFRMESHLLSYHLGQPLYTFVEWSELNEQLAAPGPHYVVMSAEYVYTANEVLKSRKLVPIARLEDYTHGKPQRPLVFLRTAD